VIRRVKVTITVRLHCSRDSSFSATTTIMDPTLPVNSPLGLSEIPAERFYSNTPKTPRNKRSPSTQPKSNSTPISNKAASNHTYTSQVVPHDVHNEKLAQEMEMLFVGPMPPKDFLMILLNVDHDTDKLIDPTPFEKVSEAQNEPEMHQKFVSILFYPVTSIHNFAGWSDERICSRRVAFCQFSE